MVPTNVHHTIQTNYNCFLAELTELTRKYGVAVKSVGGVLVAEDPDEFHNITYVADIRSGDLLPLGHDQDL